MTLAVGRETRSCSGADGGRLAYHVLGQGPPLVCHPGGPGRASVYLENLGGLSQTRMLIELDARGTGGSELPGDRTALRFDRLAEDVEAVRQHLGLPQLDLLSHSAGAIVAQAYAAAHADRLRSLVLVTPSDRLQGGGQCDDVTAIRAGRSAESWYADAAAAEEALRTARAAEQQRLVRRTRPFFYGRWDERAQAHAADAEVQSSARAELGFGTGLDDVDVPAMLERLRAVDIPVLVLAGERDGLTGVAAAETVAASFPRATVQVLAGAGHFPWVDEPDAFRSAVEGFLERAATQLPDQRQP